MGPIVCISFVHDCICLFSFVHLLLFYFSQGGGEDMLSAFSDLGFENGPNRLYFFCRWLYTPFFVCTPLTFLPLPGGWGHAIPHVSDFGFENGFNRLYFVCTWLLTSFFVYKPLTFLLPLPEGTRDMLSTLFLIFDSKMGSIVFFRIQNQKRGG